jgi:hypothetical protein
MTEVDQLMDTLRPIVNGETDLPRPSMALAEAIWDTVKWFTDHDSPNPVEQHLGEG